MGHLRPLAPTTATVAALLAPPCVSVLCAWRPPAAVAAATASAPLGRQSFPSRRMVALFAARRGPFFCRMKGSDITSDLELAKTDGRRKPNRRVNGVFWILLLNLGIYVADHILQFRQIKALYLYHSWPSWYQFVTATFCHANWHHLSSNLFFLYIFGKLVEEEEGNLALWISYILTGAGANLVSWLLLPTSAVSVGASGAIFGLFAISVLVKVMEAAQASTSLTDIRGSFMSVNHIAHLSGALIGAALVLIISRIPSEPSGQVVKSLRGDKDKRT